MSVSMMNVGIVRMQVHHWFVSMPVSVRLRIRHRRITRPMDVPMMLVVHVRVVMLLQIVAMMVLVPLSEV
jgi:hypothetical protein